MRGVNLIPAARRQQWRRRRRTHAWVVTCASYALLLGLTYALFARAAASDDQAIAHKLEKLPKDIQDMTRTIGTLQAQLSETRAKLDAVRAVAEQPNWGILLALVGEAVGGDVVLNDLRLDPMQPIDRNQRGSAAPARPFATPIGPPTSQPARPQGYTLYIGGLGRSQSAVSQFVLRLERIGLFDRVALIKTTRQSFGEAEATAFQLEAVIRATEVASGS